MTKPRRKAEIRLAAARRVGALSLAPMPALPRTWRDVFLEVLAGGGSTALAARAAGKARSSVYEARISSPRFAAAWDEALMDGRGRAFGWSRYSMGLSGQRHSVQRWIGTVQR
jgi:hypothetical protein